jgi:hypothetical protein
LFFGVIAGEFLLEGATTFLTKRLYDYPGPKIGSTFGFTDSEEGVTLYDFTIYNMVDRFGDYTHSPSSG